MKKAKRKLGEAGSGESPDASGTSPGTSAREDFTGPGGGAVKSVESMLREFSSAGAGAPRPGRAPPGKVRPALAALHG